MDLLLDTKLRVLSIQRDHCFGEPYEVLWMLFSKSVHPQEVINEVEIIGNPIYANPVLALVAVMA